MNLSYFKLTLSNTIYSLKYLRSKILGCNDIGIIKSEFVAKIKVLKKMIINTGIFEIVIFREKEKFKIFFVKSIKKVDINACKITSKAFSSGLVRYGIKSYKRKE